jgi:hypothetical protein
MVAAVAARRRAVGADAANAGPISVRQPTAPRCWLSTTTIMEAYGETQSEERDAAG